MIQVRIPLVLVIAFFLATAGYGQSSESKVVLITLDGYRWQELFTGADPELITNEKYVSDTTELSREFWSDNPVERRKILTPFFWSTIASDGQIYGNRNYGNYVNLTNNQWFSYPGYNEILCGFADDKRINSNDKMNNPNVTVLEFLHGKPGLKGKIAAFTSWDVFPYIINEERSGIPVNAGYEDLEDAETPEEILLNRIQNETPRLWNSVRLDAFTHHMALNCLKKDHPRVLYISYGETDDFAHEGEYDHYLYSARQTDAFIREIWETLQSDPFYRDQTSLIISTDHGRGVEGENWQHHGKSGIPRSDETWIMAIGPGIKPKGEIKSSDQIGMNQIAGTIVKIMGYKYPVKQAGENLWKRFSE